jgi:hypothetical protein
MLNMDMNNDGSGGWSESAEIADLINNNSV